MTRYFHEFYQATRQIRLFHATRECPMTFNDRLVYAFISYRSKYKAGSSNRTTARFTGLHQSTVAASVTRLSGWGLVHRKRPGWYAAEPGEAVRCWFVAPQKLS